MQAKLLHNFMFICLHNARRCQYEPCDNTNYAWELTIDGLFGANVASITTALR